MSNDSSAARRRTRRRRTYLPAAERRRGIILAAQQVFARTSLQGAKTRDLARAAKVNQATLFEHFPSKEALFRAAVIEPMLEAMRGMRDRAQSYEAAGSLEELRERARPSAERHLDVMVKIFPLLTAALFSDLEAGRQLYREQIAPLLRERAGAIRGLMKPEMDAELVELMGFGTLFALAMDRTFNERPVARDKLMDQWLLLTTTGFAKVPSKTRGRCIGGANELAKRRPLGRSGLQVAPLTLGSEAFTTAADKPAANASRSIETYIAYGGNCIDLSTPAAEAVAARIVARHREQLVIATHCPLEHDERSGSHVDVRRRVVLTVERSLKRLKTDRIDLLFLDGWSSGLLDTELMAALEVLVQAGKIRGLGLANLPGWRAARLHARAELQQVPLIALQPSAELDRDAHDETLVMGRDLGLGVFVRSHQARNWFAAKQAEIAAPPRSRMARRGSGRKGTASGWPALDVIAEELQRSPAQVALAWLLLNPAVASSLVNIQDVTQLDTLCGALDIAFSTEQITRLDIASGRRPGQR